MIVYIDNRIKEFLYNSSEYNEQLKYVTDTKAHFHLVHGGYYKDRGQGRALGPARRASTVLCSSQLLRSPLHRPWGGGGDSRSSIMETLGT